jgi:3-oxoadipate enol-lactonase
MRMRFDDANLEVLDEGSGTPLVLLHGFPLAKETWAAQAAALRRRARVVSIDLRGLGASRGGPGPYLMEALAGDVASVLDALGIERAAVAGHSLGTYVAFAFFRMFEERVLGLGLVCGRADADAPEVATRRYALAERAEIDGMAPLADDYVPRYFAPPVYRERPDLVERARSIVLATEPRGAAAVLRGMAMRVAADDLFESIRVPVTVVAGRDDGIVPLAHQESIARAIDRARLTVLESGHVPHFEAPAELTAALQDLLNDVDRR